MPVPFAPLDQPPITSGQRETSEREAFLGPARIFPGRQTGANQQRRSNKNHAKKKKRVFSLTPLQFYPGQNVRKMFGKCSGNVREMFGRSPLIHRGGTCRDKIACSENVRKMFGEYSGNVREIIGECHGGRNMDPWESENRGKTHQTQ